MLTIAVCDDEESEREQTAALVSGFLAQHPGLEGRVSLFEDAASLVDSVRQGHSFDLYILDILMPQLSGIDAARQLRELGDRGILIYLTTSRDFAVESYETEAFYYLLKPVTAERLDQVLTKATASLAEKPQENLLITGHSGLCRVPYDQILYVELVDRAMLFHLADGSTVSSCILREPFSTAVKPLLEDPRFLLCGSSFAINLQRIKAIGKLETLFTTGSTISLPRSQHRTVKLKWMEYWLNQSSQL